jgi:hypothetical protein
VRRRLFCSRAVRIAMTVALPLTVVGGASWLSLEAGARYFKGWRPENRQTIYALHGAVRPGMPVGELERLLESAEYEALKRAWSPERSDLSVWVPIGLTRTCYLHVQVSGGRVVHAAVRGDEGNEDRFPDAPPDF